MASRTVKMCDYCGESEADDVHVSTVTACTDLYVDAAGSSATWRVDLDICNRCLANWVQRAVVEMSIDERQKFVRAIGRGKIPINHQGGK